MSERATPETDVISRSVESDAMLLPKPVPLDIAHQFAADTVKRLADHARRLERQRDELVEILERARTTLIMEGFDPISSNVTRAIDHVLAKVKGGK